MLNSIQSRIWLTATTCASIQSRIWLTALDSNHLCKHVCSCHQMCAVCRKLNRIQSCIWPRALNSNHSCKQACVLLL